MDEVYPSLDSNPFQYQKKGIQGIGIDIGKATRHTPSVVSQKHRATRKRSEPSAKNDSEPYTKFTDALKMILSVPHSKVKSQIEAAKKKRTIKDQSASHA
jgi:hypothetical protein